MLLMGYSDSILADVLGQVPRLADDSELSAVLDLADDPPLLNRLDEYNRTGRPPYPVRAMWRAILTKYLLGIRYNVELVAMLRSNAAVRQCCGFGLATPNESVVCRFFKRLTQHQDLVETALTRLIDRVAGAVAERKGDRQPPVGWLVALDSTDIDAWVDTSREPFSDPDARWGVRTNAQAEGGKEYFFGYKMHAICDAYYGVPLGFIILPANRNDSPQLPPLIEKVQITNPNLTMRYAMADRGYDALTNYEFLDDQGIYPIIHIRNTDKNGLYTVAGRPKCVGGKAMEYVGTHPTKGHLFRCSAEGCRLKDKIGFSRYCDDETYEKPESELLRRVGRIPRAGKRWGRLYKWRTTIERWFGSMKASRILNLHRYRKSRKVLLHATLSTLTYLATMLHRVISDNMADMRKMRLPLPVARVDKRILRTA